MHPRYLDSRGLVALWREALLAQTVLARASGGDQRHPQLQRFRQHSHPSVAIATYLTGVASEADVRGYEFDKSKIGPVPEPAILEVTSGQLEFEWAHLARKLASRSPAVAETNASVAHADAHPMFRIVPGPIADWERVGDDT